MDNNFNRVRLCGRAAGEPELSHINHGESFYRLPCRWSGFPARRIGCR